MVTLFLACMVALTPAAWGQEGGEVRFTQQGRLLDASGAPLEGELTLVVGIHASEDAPTALWSRSFPGTTVSGGYYAVTLAGADDRGVVLDAVVAPDQWMSFAVGGVELVARQPFGAVPTAARAHGVVMVDSTQPCSMTGGLGFDEDTSQLVVCVGGAWDVVGRGDGLGDCPAGFVSLGPSCISTSPRSSKRWDQAVSDCFASNARLCTSQEMVVACQRDSELALSFPSDEQFWYGNHSLDWWSGGYAVTNHVFRKANGTTCYNVSSGYNRGDITMTWQWGNDTRRHYCCIDR